MAWLFIALYGLFALIATLNLLLMRRPRRASGGPEICALIPARNEESNLADLLPLLAGPNPNLRILVYDDESTDRTAEVAAELGARVLRPGKPLPEGWVGKNRACHELAAAAILETRADWLLFLDADVRPAPDFLEAMSWLIQNESASYSVFTGFPRIRSGKGIEPLFLAWVGWVLLATNPFGVVSRTRLGHNMFMNGQVQLWSREAYEAHWPHRAVRAQIMEDVMIGRLMAKRGEAVEVVNLSKVLSVRMYDTWRETLDGMSKNSYEVAGTIFGSIGLAAFFLAVGWGWLLAGHEWGWCLGLFAWSGLMIALVVRTAIWPALLMPAVLSIASVTVLRSTYWHATGRVKWKGRTYPKSPGG